jgi:hypothetical protein
VPAFNHEGVVIVSDMSMPNARAGAASRDAIRGLAPQLVAVPGRRHPLDPVRDVVLSYNVGNLLALAVFAGSPSW